jgi:hypothetical protein
VPQMGSRLMLTQLGDARKVGRTRMTSPVLPLEETKVSVQSTQSLMDRYFAAMSAEEDFSKSFEEDVTWLMVDSGDEVRGSASVRNYILELHSRMQSGDQRPLVVADDHALLEGSSVNTGNGNGAGLAYCLIYDVSDDRISAMRCYGTLARLMPASG